MPDIEEKQAIEMAFWRNSEHESPGANSIHNFVNKVSDAAILLDCLDRYRKRLVVEGRVLELGGGQGWASCVYKRLFPRARVTASDISVHAIMSLPEWERVFGVRVEHSYACRSYEIPEADASQDLVFCFAAAHHFLAHRRTLREISRILKPGAMAIFFYEPSTPRLLHRPAHWRVNRKRPEVPEDVLVTSRMRALGREAGLDLQVDPYPSLIRRGGLEAVYYLFLNRLPVLQRFLPCTSNFLFTKGNGG